MSPKISVIVPSYNQGAYLGDCLRSIIGQGYENLELIVVDGGSTDESIEVIERHNASIFYWRSAKDGGQAAAINEGFRRSSGEILCWLNSDDMYMPGALHDIAARLSAERTKANLVYGASIIIRHPDGADLEAPVAIPAPSRPFDRELLTHASYLIQPSTFWTRPLWERTGELRSQQHYAFDWEWFIRASAHVDFTYVPKFFSIYRQHPLHKSGQHSPKRREELQSIIREHAPEYWKGIYEEVNRSYDFLRKRERQLARLRLRGRRRLLPMLFPRLFRRLKSHEDLYTALEMWD